MVNELIKRTLRQYVPAEERPRWHKALAMTEVVAGAVVVGMIVLACAVWVWLYLVMPWG